MNVVTDENPDTVTPLDGDGHNVVYPPVANPGPVTPNVSKAEFDTSGRTVVATPRGYAFQPNDIEIPVIDHAGVKVTKEQADALVDESDGLVSIRKTENEEG
jgi:hypothetical protein